MTLTKKCSHSTEKFAFNVSNLSSAADNLSNYYIGSSADDLNRCSQFINSQQV